MTVEQPNHTLKELSMPEEQPKLMDLGEDESPLHLARLAWKPPLPPALQNLHQMTVDEDTTTDPHAALAPGEGHSLKMLFPQIFGQKVLAIVASSKTNALPPVKIGVVLSGGQAPGGHNVIAGIYDALKSMNPKSQLTGFVGGPGGIVKNKYIRLTGELIDRYRNTGGFDIIGSGRTKIETLKQFKAAAAAVESQDLDGLVVIGGDDSNTNAALLAEYFAQQKVKTKVIGVPKTIDGDLCNEYIEISFGYDSCCKVYANEIGNIARDAKSAAKYWFFIKMMGRSASHITLECALQAKPNMALISEEIKRDNRTLKSIVNEIADCVQERADVNREYGVLLVPEGLIEFIPEFSDLIAELNRNLATSISQTVLNVLKKPEQKIDYIESTLSEKALASYTALPLEIKMQLILDRDPHGNVQVSQIETEKLLGEMVQEELVKRAAAGKYKGKFDPRYHFCGYQGRACFPSNFDSKYCYALGHVAAVLIEKGKTGYITCVRNLAKPVAEWKAYGVPLTGLMAREERHGEMKPVIRKALVDLEGKKFQVFAANRHAWLIQDAYRYTGPMQYGGNEEVTEMANFHVRSFL